MIACSTLRNGQVTDKKVRAPLVFTQLQYYCFAYCFYLSWPGVEQGSSTFWAAIHQPDIIHQSAIPHLKEGIQGFHLSPKTAIVASDFVDKMTRRHLYWFAPRINFPPGNNRCRFRRKECSLPLQISLGQIDVSELSKGDYLWTILRNSPAYNTQTPKNL